MGHSISLLLARKWFDILPMQAKAYQNLSALQMTNKEALSQRVIKQLYQIIYFIENSIEKVIAKGKIILL